MDLSNVSMARSSLMKAGFSVEDIPTRPGRYSESTINNDICFFVFLRSGEKVTWIYDRITERFKRLE